MKLIVGSPGTWSGMALRVSQCVFSAASVCAMVTGFGFSNYSAFAYMNTVLILQFMWSLGLAYVDIFSLRNKKDLHDPGVVTLIVIGDWIMAVLIFAGASASASVVILFMQSVRAFDHLGVHRVGGGCCIFFLRVLATGFVFLAVSHAMVC